MAQKKIKITLDLQPQTIAHLEFLRRISDKKYIGEVIDKMVRVDKAVFDTTKEVQEKIHNEKLRNKFFIKGD